MSAVQFKEHEAAVARWESFALAQQDRTAPHTASDSLAACSRPACYRLRLSHLDSMPLFQAADRNFEIRACLTLFDEATGCFFGRTMRGPAVQYEMRQSRGKRGFHVTLDLATYFQTRATILAAAAGNPGLCVVAELVLVERSEAGVELGEQSAGWARIPLHLPSGAESYVPQQAGTPAARPGMPAPVALAAAAQSPTTPLAGGAASHSPAAAHAPWPGGRGAVSESGGPTWQRGPMTPTTRPSGPAGTNARPVMHCVPVLSGSPRYLLLQRELPAEQCYSPPPLTAGGTECYLHYVLEVWPEMESWAALAPQDCLLCARDLIPGMQRSKNHSGLATRRCVDFHAQLSPPAVQPVVAVQLSGLSVRLPEGFLEVVRRTLLPGPHTRSQLGGQALVTSHSGSPGRVAPLPLRELQQCLRMRAAVHNGRRFVGPSVWARPATLEVAGGQRGQHVLTLAAGLPLAWLPADDMVVVVIELLFKYNGHSYHSSNRRATSDNPLLPSGGSPSGSAAGHAGSCTVLAWGALAPFATGRGASRPLAVAQGSKELALRTGRGRWVGTQPVLDWQGLLERTNRLSPDPPVATFVLQQAEGQGVWPPPATADGVSLVIRPQRAEQVPAATRPARPVQPAQPPQRSQQAQAAHTRDAIKAHRGSSADESALETRMRRRTESAPDGAGPSAKVPLPMRQAKLSGQGRVTPPPQTMQLWQIQAHYRPPGEEEALDERAEQRAYEAMRQRSDAAVQVMQQAQAEGGAAGPAAEQGMQLRLRAPSLPRVVLAWPALDEGGAVAQELAGPEMGPASPRSLKRAALERAEHKVRLLLGAPESGAHTAGSSGTSAGEELLVQQRLQSEVEVARERCKRGSILRQLTLQQGQVVVAPAADGGMEGLHAEQGRSECGGTGCEHTSAPIPAEPVARSLSREIDGQRRAEGEQAQVQAQEQIGPSSSRNEGPPPEVARAFAVVIPAGCPSVSKKVRYTNRQPHTAVFGLRTDSPDLVLLGQPTLELGAWEDGHIRMSFDAAALEGAPERTALVFVEAWRRKGSGEHGGRRLAECFKVTVTRRDAA